MKAILISIKPKYVAKILNGEKTIEIRKTMPKCDLPISVYIYATKDKKPTYLYPNMLESPNHYKINGKVVAAFTLNKVEEIIGENDGYGKMFYTKTMNRYQLDYKSGVNINDLIKYLPLPPQVDDEDDRKTVVGYAWHIDNLYRFTQPIELNHFYKVGFEKEYKDIIRSIGDKERCKKELNKASELYCLKKAPQSWGYIYDN